MQCPNRGLKPLRFTFRKSLQSCPLLGVALCVGACAGKPPSCREDQYIDAQEAVQIVRADFRTVATEHGYGDLFDEHLRCCFVYPQDDGWFLPMIGIRENPNKFEVSIGISGSDRRISVYSGYYHLSSCGRITDRYTSINRNKNPDLEAVK
jgi:hypothetical protein